MVPAMSSPATQPLVRRDPRQRLRHGFLRTSLRQLDELAELLYDGGSDERDHVSHELERMADTAQTLGMEPVRDTELYDLANDPSERRNVASRHPEIVAELTKLADAARSEIGDYDRIGSGARFFDAGEHRPEVRKWQAKSKDSLDQEIIVHPFYDDGSRVI